MVRLPLLSGWVLLGASAWLFPACGPSGPQKLRETTFLLTDPRIAWQRSVIEGGGEYQLRTKPQEPTVLRIESGELLSGTRAILDPAFTWPVTNYEIHLEARRVAGNDIFCGLTFPVGESHATLVVGGWGGGLVGLSSIDGYDASENFTRAIREFENGRWFRIRLEVKTTRIRAWIDDAITVNARLEGRQIDLRPGPINQCLPLGLATWQTDAEFRRLRLVEIR